MRTIQNAQKVLRIFVNLFLNIFGLTPLDIMRITVYYIDLNSITIQNQITTAQGEKGDNMKTKRITVYVPTTENKVVFEKTAFDRTWREIIIVDGAKHNMDNITMETLQAMTKCFKAAGYPVNYSIIDNDGCLIKGLYYQKA